MRSAEELAGIIQRVQEALDDFVRLSEATVGAADENFAREAARLRDDVGTRLKELLEHQRRS